MVDCHNEDHTRQLNRKMFDIRSSEFNSCKKKLKKMLKCKKLGDQEVDDEYAWFLGFLIGTNDETKLIPSEDENKIKSKIKNKEEKDKDPQYCMFLKNLAEHGKSYKLNISQNETPCFLEYENDEDDMNSSEDMEIEHDSLTQPNNDITVESCYQTFLEGSVPSEYGTFHYKENQVKYEENVADSDSDIQILDNIKDFSEINNKKSADANKDSSLKEKLMKILRKPYNGKEYKKLLEYAEEQKPICRHLDLRGRPISSSLKGVTKSLLDYAIDFRRILEAAKDERPRALNLLRMFHFWLKHVPDEESFRPWLDDDCLNVLPSTPVR